jgi:hypothetical protein
MASVQAIAERREKARGRQSIAVTDGHAAFRPASMSISSTSRPKDPELAAVVHLENAAAVLDGNDGGLIRFEAAKIRGTAAGRPRQTIKSHTRLIGSSTNFIAPTRDAGTGQPATDRIGSTADNAAGEDVVELTCRMEWLLALAQKAKRLALLTDADTAADDETDQSDEAKARRASAHRTVEHRTTKK